MNDTGHVQIVRCEIHGIRYNAATHDGCVRCRKERGELPAPAVGAPAAAGPPAAAAAAPAVPSPAVEGRAALGPSLAIGLLLIAVTGTGFYAAHSTAWKAIESDLQELQGLEADPDMPAAEKSQFEQMMEELSDQEDGDEYDDLGDEYDDLGDDGGG